MFMFISPVPVNTRTHTSIGGNLSKRVVAAIALAAHHSHLASALSCVRVTGASMRSQREAVAGVAGVAVRLPIIVILQERR